MSILLAVLYVVHAISLPSGMTVDLEPSPGGYITAPAPGPPSSISLSPAGAIAVIMYPEDLYPSAAGKLLIVRPDSSRIVLEGPSDGVLAKYFVHYTVTKKSAQAYPGAHFAGVKLARDGTPFATVNAAFSGAYSGADDAVFEWNGQEWINALPEHSALGGSNVTLGAADQPWRAAYNVNYNNTFANLDAFSDPHYQEYWTFLGDGKKQAKLGYGTSTGMRGDTVVGFSAGLRSLVSSRPLPCLAWKWVGGRRVKLGPGIAYGVNANGDVVGDDEPVLGPDGVPVLWHSGAMIKLSHSKGSAYEIADDGTVIGRVGDDGFVIRGGDANRTITRIDTLLATPGWHVTVVYGVASSGRLMAVGQQAPQQQLRLLLLDPKG